MRRCLIAAVTTLALALPLGPLAPASGQPAPAPTQSRAAWLVESGLPRTHIVLRVQTCRQCPVRLVQADVDRFPRYWSTATKKVKRGVVQFTIPSRRTVGMSIDVTPRWEDSNAAPNVVFRYGGTSEGEVISARQARRMTRASGCWIGTEAARIDMVIRATRSPRNLLRVWVRQSRQATQPFYRVERGYLGNQEGAMFCDP